MMKAALATIGLLVAGVSASEWKPNSPSHPRGPRALFAVAPLDTCPPIARLVVEIRPICYSQIFSSATVITPFVGVTVTVSVVPTTVVTISTQTQIVEASTSASASTWQSVPVSVVITGSQSFTIPAGSSNTGVNGGQSTSVNNGGQITTSSAIATSMTSTIPSTATPTEDSMDSSTIDTITAAPPTPTGLGLGNGIPSGVVTDLPDDQFFFLAFSASTTNPLVPTGVPQIGVLDVSPPEVVIPRQQNLHRQGAQLDRRQDSQGQAPSIEMRPLRLVTLGSAVTVSGDINLDQCDSADALLLRQGRLVQYDNTVGKALDETLSQLGFLIPPPAGYIDQTFALVNGILQWSTPDVGSALFFSCNGQVFAAYNQMMPAGCTQLVVGAIDGAACRDQVQQTRSPVATFTAPIGAAPTSSIVQSSTWTVPTSTASGFSTISPISSSVATGSTIMLTSSDTSLTDFSTDSTMITTIAVDSSTDPTSSTTTTSVGDASFTATLSFTSTEDFQESSGISSIPFWSVASTTGSDNPQSSVTATSAPGTTPVPTSSVATIQSSVISTASLDSTIISTPPLDSTQSLGSSTFSSPTSSSCQTPLQTPDNAINDRMSEALRTGNPDLVTESELLQQVSVSLDGRKALADTIIPDGTTVTWLLDPNTGFVRSPGSLDTLLIGNQNTQQSTSPANKILATIGQAPNFDARLAYFGGNPFVTNDAGTSSWRATDDPGLSIVLQNSARYLVPIDTCDTTNARRWLQSRQSGNSSNLNIVLANALNSAESATLASLRLLFPGAVINGGKTNSNACDFVAGQTNPCLSGANLLIVGDDANTGDGTIAQQIVDLHRNGLALLVMTENGNPTPLTQKVMTLLGVTVGQNYFNGKTVIQQATKAYLVPNKVITDQISADSLTMVQYLRDDPLVPSDYSSCLSTTTSGVGDTMLIDCIEDPATGVSTHAQPYFAALKRFRTVYDSLSASGIDIFNSAFGSQTEVVRVLTLLSDKYRRGPGQQPDDTAVAISYPVDLRNDGVAASKSFYADWLTPRATKATGRPESLGSLYCPERVLAETNIASCQSPVFPDVGNYPLTLRSAPEDRFTSTSFDQVPGSASTVTLQSDPGFPVYLRFLAGNDRTSRATLLSPNGAVSTYNRPAFAVGPYIRLMPNMPVTINTPYGGPLYIRLAANIAIQPVDVQFAFENVARHPTLFYPATDAQVSSFASELSTSNAYWADIVDDVFEVHSPISKLKASLTSAGLDVEAPPRRVYYDNINGLSDLIEDFRNGWAGREFLLAGLKVRAEPLSSTLSQDDQQICSDLGIPCLNETINTFVVHQHVTYDAYSACGGLCSGNPITIGGQVKPIGYGEGHELGHNLQRVQLGIFWPDTALGSQLSVIDSWSNYVRRDQETSNNIFPVNNIYQYFRYTLPGRSNSLPDNGIIGSHDRGKDLNTFSAHASAYSGLRLNGQQVVLDSSCAVLGSYPIGTRPDVMLANAIWSSGSYNANNAYRLTFYLPLPDLVQGRVMSNGVKLTDGRDIFTLLYQAARAFTIYAASLETWTANRASLGLSLFEYQNDAVYGTGKTVNAMIGNDFMLVLLCRITGYDFRPYFASRGVFYTSLANQQVEANGAAGPALRDFGKPFLALNTQLPQANRTSVLGTLTTAYISNDVYFNAADPTVTFPGADDNRDGIAEAFVGFHPRSCAGVTTG